MTIIETADRRQEFVLDVDGLVYYWPQGAKGCLAAYHLRALADELDRRNSDWNAVIDKDPSIGLVRLKYLPLISALIAGACLTAAAFNFPDHPGLGIFNLVAGIVNGLIAWANAK